MEMSARQSSRQVRLGLVRQLRTELDDLRRGVVQASSVANRDSLFGGGVGSVSREHRQRLLDAEDRLRAGVGQIESARRIALETDGIGQDILRDLKSQRETITRSRRGMTEVGAHLSSAKCAAKNGVCEPRNGQSDASENRRQCCEESIYCEICVCGHFGFCAADSLQAFGRPMALGS
mmetsp:Transcript_13455/g.30179  ORF Transcript_13455/g.30179 Transcript_13455/m.30179 type:complete len:178 (-) Transcript_13455:618-1151(-)